MEPKTSKIFESTSNKMKTSTPFFKTTLGVFFLALVLGLPSGITAWFDGLPWTGEMETIVLTVLIPFLLILGWRFLSLQLPIILLGALLIIKITLFLGSPSGGWLVKVHPNLSQEQSENFFPFQTVEENGWVKTYATFWDEKSSGILQKPWTEKLDFPLDWVLINGPGCGISTITCFNELNPIVEIEGVLLLPEGRKLVLVARGVEEGTFSVTNDNGESFNLSPAKNIEEAGQHEHQIPKGGKWQVSGKFKYEGRKWSLIPALVDANGEITSELGRDMLWQNGPELAESLNMIWFYKMFSLVVDFGIILFLFIWATWTARLLAQEQILNLPLVVFSISAIYISIFMAPIFEYILTKLGSSDPTTVSYLGFSVTAVAMGFLVWVYWKKDFRNFNPDRVSRSIFLFFGPALLVYFTYKWRPILGQWALWSFGDDWTHYQAFARKIIIDGEWLIAGADYIQLGQRGVFWMQPLYRYFVGFYHLLFGQSVFVQHMADVWCVLGATALTANWAIKFRVSTLIVFMGSICYLMICLVGAFRYHIGNGLIEHHAMIFMVLAGWLLCSAREGNYLRIIGAGICGIIGYLLRQDHLIVIAMLVFFIVEPIHGTMGEVWRTYWEQIRKYWKRGFTYTGIWVFGFFLLCFRNWWVAGVFGPAEGMEFFSDRAHPISAPFDLEEFYFKIKLIIVGVISGTPSFATIILLPGTLFGLLALIWRPKFLRAYPMAIGWVLIGVLLPYAFLTNQGYAPRYSIHLLPLALLSVMIILDYFLKRFSLFENRFG